MEDVWPQGSLIGMCSRRVISITDHRSLADNAQGVIGPRFFPSESFGGVSKNGVVAPLVTVNLSIGDQLPHGG